MSHSAGATIFEVIIVSKVNADIMIVVVHLRDLGQF